MTHNIIKKRRIRLGLPLQIILLFGLFYLLGSHIPLDAKRFFYSVSLSIKDLLIFVLPLIIFSYLFSCFLSLKKGIFFFIISILGAIIASNFITVQIAYWIGRLCLHDMHSLGLAQAEEAMLSPLWTLNIRPLVDNKYALFAGMALGIVFNIWKIKAAHRIANQLKELSNRILSKGFIPLVPLFISGFLIKMEYEEMLGDIVRQYGPIFILIFIAQIAYLAVIYFIAAGLNVQRFLQFVRNMLPAALTGFSTMSSAAALPLLFEGSERNTENPDAVRTILPLSVNIHLVGCNFSITLTSLAIMLSYGMPFPEYSHFLVFSFFFVMMKFSAAAVPAGGCIVMLPILEKNLGFNADMASLVLTLYILFDALTTMANVANNGAFTILFEKFSRKMGFFDAPKNKTSS